MTHRTTGMKNIINKRVLLTGAASGIGRELALQLADRGARLMLVDRNPNGLEETAAQCREKSIEAKTCVADLTEPEAIDQIVTFVRDVMGGADILINNAGLGYYGSSDKMTPEQYESILAVNFTAPICLTQKMLPLLLENEESHLVNMASMYGLFPTQRSSIYHATKYGLVGYSLALRTEYARYRLGVSTICPGFVSTPFLNNLMTSNNKTAKAPPKWMTTTPEKIAIATINAINHNHRLVRLTPAAKICDWLQRGVPGLIDLIYRAERKRLHPHAKNHKSNVVQQVIEKDTA